MAEARRLGGLSDCCDCLVYRHCVVVISCSPWYHTELSVVSHSALFWLSLFVLCIAHCALLFTPPRVGSSAAAAACWPAPGLPGCAAGGTPAAGVAAWSAGLLPCCQLRSAAAGWPAAHRAHRERQSSCPTVDGLSCGGPGKEMSLPPAHPRPHLPPQRQRQGLLQSGAFEGGGQVCQPVCVGGESVTRRRHLGWAAQRLSCAGHALPQRRCAASLH